MFVCSLLSFPDSLGLIFARFSKVIPSLLRFSVDFVKNRSAKRTCVLMDCIANGMYYTAQKSNPFRLFIQSWCRTRLIRENDMGLALRAQFQFACGYNDSSSLAASTIWENREAVNEQSTLLIQLWIHHCWGCRGIRKPFRDFTRAAPNY